MTRAQAVRAATRSHSHDHADARMGACVWERRARSGGCDAGGPEWQRGAEPTIVQTSTHGQGSARTALTLARK